MKFKFKDGFYAFCRRSLDRLTFEEKLFLFEVYVFEYGWIEFDIRDLMVLPDAVLNAPAIEAEDREELTTLKTLRAERVLSHTLAYLQKLSSYKFVMDHITRQRETSLAAFIKYHDEKREK